MPETINYASGNFAKPRFIPPPKWQRWVSVYLFSFSLLVYVLAWAHFSYGMRHHDDSAFEYTLMCMLVQIGIMIVSLIWIVFVGFVPLCTRSKAVSKLNLLLAIASLAMCIHSLF